MPSGPCSESPGGSVSAWPTSSTSSIPTWWCLADCSRMCSNLERAVLTAQMRAGVVTEAQLDVEIVPPSLGRESVLLGAAEIALEPVLLDPGRIPAVIRPELRRSLPGEPLLSEEGA